MEHLNTELPQDVDPHGYPTVAGCPICRRQSAASLRDQGMAQTTEAQPEWAEVAWRALMDLSRTGKPFTAEDLVDVVGMPPTSGKAIGAVFNKAAKRGIIRKVGERPTTRVSSHLRSLAVWQGSRVEKDEDGQWLW
jgi:hypothetical protein